MHLQIGKKYKTRDGFHVVTIVKERRIDESDMHDFIGESPEDLTGPFTEEGFYLFKSAPHMFDLVEEVP